MNTPALKGPIAVIGAGTMGIGIAQVAAQAGHTVLLFDMDSTAARHALDGLHARLHQRVEAGKAEAGPTEALLQRITPVDSLQALAPCALVIEAIIEQLEAKQELFRQLGTICSAKALFASNTSSLSITAIARAVPTPQRMAGLHFFNPAPLMKLVEIVQGLETSPQTVMTLKALISGWKKQPVICRSTPGFIVNRIARPFYAEALRALEEQVATPATLDAVMKESGGFAMGPLQLMDLIGHDINYTVTESLFRAFHSDPRFQPSLQQKELVDAGHLGRKRGRGFYHHDLKGNETKGNHAKDHDNNKKETQPAPKIEPKHAKAQKQPDRIRATGNWHALPYFTEFLKQSELQKYGIIFEEHKNDRFHSPTLQIDDVVLTLTKGRTCAQIADEIRAPVMQFDLSANHHAAPIITLSTASQNPPQQTARVIGFLQSLGKQIILLPDYPALLTMRTVAMLCNEALDALNKGVASAEDIDLAMRYGVNYPIGPLEWGEQIGWKHLLSTLENLQKYYGEPRYRPAPLLRQLAAGHAKLQLSPQHQNHNRGSAHV
ncbi:3-hydroxyacyl-CoA dehydrogenase [Xenorhabdus sp. 12]|uniref:3-hydroxyacyl-CoA dehydrogenase n=1 Tax=Xenorhabdus santafensis TaxID=2582833 RepID=A0ABU4S4F5_9GAMM|nr:3-hydroxyacyl-CoA dehydrogenase [Xenorhabdus sp. 12]MDX7986089.1 3-hydroxyacyl-CoA dehydrogenase [Xenorhabdus sp. 12]